MSEKMSQTQNTKQDVKNFAWHLFHHISLLEKFNSIPKNSLCISVVTYAELQYGIERSSSKKMNQTIINDFVSHLTVYSWDMEAARQY